MTNENNGMPAFEPRFSKDDMEGWPTRDKRLVEAQSVHEQQLAWTADRINRIDAAVKAIAERLEKLEKSVSELATRFIEVEERFVALESELKPILKWKPTAHLVVAIIAAIVGAVGYGLFESLGGKLIK